METAPLPDKKQEKMNRILERHLIDRMITIPKKPESVDVEIIGVFWDGLCLYLDMEFMTPEEMRHVSDSLIKSEIAKLTKRFCIAEDCISIRSTSLYAD